jgi:hypothetical protein
MAVSGTRTAQAKRGRREPLLIYQRLNEQVFWPSILILLTCVILLIWTPAEIQDRQIFLLVITVFTALILAMTFGYRLRSYAQCRSDGLVLQMPFYRLKISYQDIRETRPNDFFRIFPPKEVPRLQRNFLTPLMGKTVVLIDMRQLPKPRPVLRMMMGRYMLSPDTDSIVLSVRDWVGFRTELDEFRFRSRQRMY